ncbi:MAG: response regulator [Pseudomonadota bacterium]
MRKTITKNDLKKAVEKLGKIKVMVVDDDSRIAFIVREILESIGFTNNCFAKNGEDALRIIASEKIDMVITDWRMSHMDGISLIKHLRTSENSPNRFMPIIMLTANVEREHVEMARDSGVTEFVIKPFSAKTLCDRIALLIENPRGFIMSKAFVGPDRRRRTMLPPDNIEKRRE